MSITVQNEQSSPATDSGIASWLNVSVRGWQLASLLVALVALAPIAVVALAWLTPATDIWQHLGTTVLPDLLRNTGVLVIGVGLGVAITGVGLGWLVATCDFPGRRFFDWALMLPLAVPAYVLAFALIGLFDYSGALQSQLRDWFGPNVVLPPIRSAGGVVLTMVLAFYPYVYMLARTAFLSQGQSMIETGRVYGLTAWQSFWRVAVPMARPAIAAGVALALMETLADFGAVSVFNYDTFTTAIYKAWLGMFNLSAAAQLASVLLLFVLVALVAEQRLRGRAQYHFTPKSHRTHRYRLHGRHALAAFLSCATVFVLAFALPVGELLVWSVRSAWSDFDVRYLRFVANTLALGGTAAVVTTFFALLLAYTWRLKRDRLVRGAIRLATLGYALPGSVLAVGIMVSFVWLDRQWLTPLFESLGFGAGPWLAGSLLALMLAYGVRFLAVAYGPVDSSFERIKPSIWQAARSLGASNREILWHVSIPLLRGGLFSAGLLVFVEVMKEMPATLLLRPFGWDTLATRIFEMTSEGEWERAALPAVTLVLVGLIPVVLLVRRATPR